MIASVLGRRIVAWSVALGLSCWYGTPALAAPAPSADVLAQLEARHEKLQAVTVEYTSQIRRRAAPAAFVAKQRELARKAGLRHPGNLEGKTENYACRWMRLGANVRVERRPDDATRKILAPAPQLAICSIYGDRLEMFSEAAVGSEQDGPVGSIAVRRSMPVTFDADVEVVLGLRVEGEASLPPKGRFAVWELRADDGRRVALSKRDPHYEHEFTFDRQYGMAPAAYRTDGQHEDVEWTMEDFVETGGVWYPRRVTRTKIVGEERFVSATLEIRSLVVGGPENLESAYPIVFPNGTRIFDERLDTAFRIATGDQALDDEKLFRAAGRSDPGTRWWILGANAAVIAAVCGFVVYRVRRRCAA